MLKNALVLIWFVALGIQQLFAAEPTVAPSNAKATGITCNQASISWTNGNGSWRFVLVKEGSAVDATPSDGTNYTAFNTFKSGQQVGTGNYACFNNFTNNFILKGLKPNTTYHVAIFEHDGAASPDFLTSSYASFSFKTQNLVLDFDFTINDSCSRTNVVTFNNKSSSTFSGVSYTWIFQDGKQDTGTKTVNHTYAEGGNYQVTLVASPSYGCTDLYTNSFAVKIIPRPVSKPIELNNNLYQCLEGNQFFFADNTSLKNLPKMAYTRTWYFSATDSSTIPKPVKKFTQGGTIQIKYKSETYFDNFPTGCTDTASLWIRVIPNPSSGITINDSIQCQSGNSFVFDNTFPGLSRFYWNLGDGTTSTNKSITHTYGSVGAFPIIHEAESPEGCKSRDTIMIHVKPNVDASFSGLPTYTCENGAPITLTPTSNKGLFFATEGTFNGNIYTPGKAGTHNIKYVIRDTFCPDSVISSLQINTLPRFTLGRDTVVCDNQPLALFVTSAGTILWENASSVNPRPIFSAGTYWAEVDNNGCKWRDTVNVGYQLTPQASLPGDTLICKGSLIVLKQTWPNAIITWSTGSNDTQIYVSSPGVYSVAVVNSCGSATDFMEVKVSDGFCDVFIPTAFTPNGDDRNEYFEIQGRDIQPVLLQIFNRWGEIIFDSERSGEYRWYGDANGQPCMEGNYPFIYRYEQKVGDRIRRQTIKGAVMILK